MAGKSRFLIAGLAIIVSVSLILSGIIIILDSGETGIIDQSSLVEEAGPLSLPGDMLLDELEGVYYSEPGSAQDVNTTVVYNFALEIAGEDTEYMNGTVEASTVLNSTSTENLAFVAMAMPSAYYDPTDNDSANYYDVGGAIPTARAATDLVTLQEADGSWNNDISDTALATYALIIDGKQNNASVVSGVEWLSSKKADGGWGSPELDAKAILAIGRAGNDVTGDLGRLIKEQESNGSFGNVTATSWAVMAIAENLDGFNYLDAARAVSWLRSQNIQDSHELALAALAEQYYNESFTQAAEGAALDISEEGTGVMPLVYGLVGFVTISIAILLVLFARIREEDVLEGVRKDIYEYIEHNPGDHLAGITRRFNISSSSARHHLEVLEWSELIVSHKAEKMRHYYPNRNGYCIYGGSAGYKEVLAALRNPTAREMVKFIMGNERANQTAVAVAMDMHPSTVNWHAKRLIAAGIISRTREGKDIHYSLGSELDLQKAIALIEGEAPLLEVPVPAIEGASG